MQMNSRNVQFKKILVVLGIKLYNNFLVPKFILDPFLENLRTRTAIMRNDRVDHKKITEQFFIPLKVTKISTYSMLNLVEVLKSIFQKCCLSTHTSLLRVWPKLHIPSTINIWRKLLNTIITADKKWADFLADYLVHQGKTKILNNIAIYLFILNF